MMRGQMQHVFSFIMFALVAGIILLLGYKFFFSISKDSCEADKLQFQTALSDDLKRYAKHGAIGQPEWPVPCDAEKVCFVDASVFGAPSNGVYPGTQSSSKFNDANTVILSEVKSPSTPPKNVFVIADGKTQDIFFAEKVALENPTTSLCVASVGGVFRVRLEGRGLTVLVKTVY